MWHSSQQVHLEVKHKGFFSLLCGIRRVDREWTIHAEVLNYLQKAKADSLTVDGEETEVDNGSEERPVFSLCDCV